jgi:hypothetical protein
VTHVYSEVKKLASHAEYLFEKVLLKDPTTQMVTVDSMLSKMISKNAIQEQCIEFFNKKKGKKAELPTAPEAKSVFAAALIDV